MSIMAMDRWLHHELTPETVHIVLRARRPHDIVAATGVSLRTAYRWKRDVEGIVEVVAGGFRAMFVLRRGLPPARLTAWEKAPAANVRPMRGKRCGRWMPLAGAPCARFEGHSPKCATRENLSNRVAHQRESRARERRAAQRAMAAA